MLEKYAGSKLSMELENKFKSFIILENNNDSKNFYEYIDSKSTGNIWLGSNGSILVFNIDGGEFKGIMLCSDNAEDLIEVSCALLFDCSKIKIKTYLPYIVNKFGNEINW